MKKPKHIEPNSDNDLKFICDFENGQYIPTGEFIKQFTKPKILNTKENDNSARMTTENIDTKVTDSKVEYFTESEGFNP